MSHTPTLLDAASDLLRCIYCISDDNLNNKNFLHFFRNAKDIINRNDYLLEAEKLHHIQKQLDLANNEKLSKSKRQEHLLLISTLLM